MTDLQSDTEVWRLSSELGERMEWKKWDDKISFLNPRRFWEVKARPPFNRAIVRYYVRDKLSGRRISIYLDGYELLGIFSHEDEPKPYWEMYPYTYSSDTYTDEGTRRVAMEEIDELEELIEEEFDTHRNLVQRLLARLFR